MTNGWVKLHRKILDNPICRKPNYSWLWVVLLLKANHKEHSFIWNNEKQICKKGQLLTGRKELSNETGIKEGTIETILNYFESQHQIQQQKTTKFRLISVLNWEEYQDIQQEFQQQTDNKLTTNRQQNDTNNNDKNNKNEKKYIAEASSAIVIKNLLEDKKKHIQIIGLYAKAKKIEFTSSEHQQSFIKRNLRSASMLKTYEFKKIADVMKWLIDNSDFKWTLETVGKYIDEDLKMLNIKNKFIKL
jgi:hypothetical protein